MAEEDGTMAEEAETRFRVVAELPAGDAIRARLAVDDRGRRVVLKTVRPLAPALFARTVARLAAPLGPHNERLLALAPEGAAMLLVAAPVPGDDLRRVMTATGAVEAVPAAALAAQAALGLAVLHERGLVHGGVKPTTLVCTPEGDIVVVDAGLAQAQGGADLTDGAAPQGAAYVSPEEVLGRELVPASDVYALGLVLYELVTGRRPFSGRDALAVARAHAGAPLVPARDLAPVLPLPIEAVIARALAKPAEDRYASGRELATALEGAVRLAVSAA